MSATLLALEETSLKVSVAVLEIRLLRERASIPVFETLSPTLLNVGSG
jgi:hypothetical protein